MLKMQRSAGVRAQCNEGQLAFVFTGTPLKELKKVLWLVQRTHIQLSVHSSSY